MRTIKQIKSEEKVGGLKAIKIQINEARHDQIRNMNRELRERIMSETKVVMGPMKRNVVASLLYESITRLGWGRYTVRIWREFEGPGNPGSMDDIYKLSEHPQFSRHFPGEVAEELLKLDRVNAVEVVDSHGEGCVIKKDRL